MNVSLPLGLGSERLWGPRSAGGVARTIVDGMALALLVGAVSALERFDAARATIDRADDVGLRPPWLVSAWVVLALCGVLLAIYVAVRITRVASGAPGKPEGLRARLLSLMPGLAGGTAVVWSVWQVVAITAVADDGSAPAAVALSVATLILAALTALAGGLLVDLRSVFSRASVVFVQLAVLAGLFTLMFVVQITSAQLNDVLRAWGDGPASRALAGIATALLLGALLRASADRLLRPEDNPMSLPTWSRWAVAGTTAVLGVACLALGGEGAAALLLLVAAAAAVTTRAPPHTPYPAWPGGDEQQSLQRFAATMGVLPLGILLVGLVGALTDSLLLPSPASDTDKALLAWTAATLVAFGLLSARAHGPFGVPWTTLDERVPGWALAMSGLGLGVLAAVLPTPATIALAVVAALLAFKAFGEHGEHELWAAWGVVGGVALAVYLEPVDVPRALGAFAMALIGLAGILTVLHVAASAGARRALLVPFPFWRQVFVPGLLAAWLAVAWLTAPGAPHRAMTDGVATASQLDAAVTTWLADEAAEPGELSMLLVGASGGGAKAAYWTDLILDCVLGEGVPTEATGDECAPSPKARDRLDRIFMTSSVSGGSIGVYNLLTQLEDVGRTEWVTPSAENEVLSPLVAWGLFHDLPVFMAGAHTDPGDCGDRLACPLDADRALVQEGALGAGRRDLRLHAQTRPLAVFNGTVGWGPQRVVMSPAELAPDPVEGDIDGYDVLAGADLPLVTASLLSARFPVLEPAALLGGDAGVRVRDGGIVENTGLLTIMQVVPRVRESIERWKAEMPEARADVDVRMIVVSIDDDVLWPDGDENERGGFKGSDLRTSLLRKKLRGCFLGAVTYLRISPSAHVGAQAATGWETSETSRREDLGESYRSGGTGVAAGVQELRDVLDGKPRRDRCDRG